MRITRNRTDTGVTHSAGQGGPKPPRWLRLTGWLYRRIRGLLALGMLILLMLLFTPLTAKLQGLLDVTQPPEAADYIVCLGGEDERMIWAAELFKQGYAPKVIVTNMGGAALVMKNRMEAMGVPSDCIMVDSASRTTGDHPGRIAALSGIDPKTQRFLIVTSLEHSRRTAACFRKAGYAHFAIIAGRSSAYQQGPTTVQTWRERAMKIPTLAYEYTALLKYRIQGRI